MDLSMTDYQTLFSRLQAETAKGGLEIAPFQIGWYNDALSDKRFAFKELPANTLAFVVISSPSMFEKKFVPFIQQEIIKGKEHARACKDHGEIKDPLDRCMKQEFLQICSTFSLGSYDIEPMHDFEICPITKRPKILVQTAGHVAGAVRFYQKFDLLEDAMNGDVRMTNESLQDDRDRLLNKMSNIFPVCVHPRYGGWFALRGILLFRNAKVSDAILSQKNPPEVLKTKAEIAELLYLFNDHWKDWRYRDVGVPVEVERYSELQKEYFATEPSGRRNVIETKFKSQGMLSDDENE